MPLIGTANASSSSLGQLSLRHIPDISDTILEDETSVGANESSSHLETSFSIHISGVGSNTLLADEDAENFFRDADVDMSVEVQHIAEEKTGLETSCEEGPMVTGNLTPRASKTMGPKLGLEGWTEGNHDTSSSVPFPSPPFKYQARIGSTMEGNHTVSASAASPGTHPRENQPSSESSQNEAQHSPPPVLRVTSPKIRQSIRITRAALQSGELTTQEPSVQPTKAKVAPRSKQKVFDSGITKSRLKPPTNSANVTKPAPRDSASEAQILKPPLTRRATRAVTKASSPMGLPQKDDEPPPADAPSFADAGSSSIVPQGVAARLMQYGKEYMTTEGPTSGPETSLLPDIDALMYESQTRNEPPAVVVPTNAAKFILDGESGQTHEKPATTPAPHFNASESLPSSGTVVEDTSEPSEYYHHSTSDDYKIEECTPEEEDDRDGPLTLSQLSPRKRALAMASKSPPSLSKKRGFPTDAGGEEGEKLPEEQGPKLKKSRGNGPAIKEARKPTLASKPRVPSTRAAASSSTASKMRTRSGTVSVSGPRKASNLVGSGSAVASSSRSKPISGAGVTPPDATRESAQRPGETRPGTRPPGREIKTNRRVVSASNAIGEKKSSHRHAVSVFNPAVGWNDDVQMKDTSEEAKEGRRLKDSKLVNSRSSLGSSNSDLKQRSMTRAHTRSQSQNVNNRQGNYHPPPDFKAIHEAFTASLAARKETFHPTVPIEMQWETDVRMEQRRKFDEMVREKEREKERLEEEARRVREEEEEREVRELRKKLVVKANEVPEWYRDVPRKVKEVGGETGIREV